MTTQPAHAAGETAIYGIPAGSKIYFEDMSGFGGDLGAALVRKKVPLVVVSDRAEADFFVWARASVENQSWWKTVFVQPVPAAHASISLKTRTGRLVYAYAYDRSLVPRGQQSSAEACAKHLKWIVR